MAGKLLEGSSAVVMNISLLTSDFWSVLAGVLLLNSRLDAWYGVAFTAVVLGLALYHYDPNGNDQHPLAQPLTQHQHHDCASCVPDIPAGPAYSEPASTTVEAAAE